MILSFAPMKSLGVDYQSNNYLENKHYPIHTPRFEELAESELLQYCQQKYGSAKVKMLGYDYRQYNNDGWSHYPVQLIVNGKLRGISWIKWQNCVQGYYFILDYPYKSSCEDYPQNIRPCTDEENLVLSASYPQPCMNEIICSNNLIKLAPDSFNPTGVSFSFIYELQRQLTNLLGELTEIKDVYKHLVLSNFVPNCTVYENGYGYSYVVICSFPFSSDNRFYTLAVRWHGINIDNIPKPTYIVDSKSITFELAQAMPANYRGAMIKIFADKSRIIEIARSSRKLKRIQIETYFPVFFLCSNYPDIKYDIIFESPVSDDEINLICTVADDFIRKYNDQNHNLIHGFDIMKEHGNEIELYVDFGDADPEVLNYFLMTISKFIHGIKKIFTY